MKYKNEQIFAVTVTLLCEAINKLVFNQPVNIAEASILYFTIFNLAKQKEQP